MVRPAPGRRRVSEVLTWLRVLVPTALLLVAPASVPDDLTGDEVVQIECTDSLDGPLAVASVLARQLSA